MRHTNQEKCENKEGLKVIEGDLKEAFLQFFFFGFLCVFVLGSSHWRWKVKRVKGKRRS